MRWTKVHAGLYKATKADGTLATIQRRWITHNWSSWELRYGRWLSGHDTLAEAKAAADEQERNQ